MSNQNKEWIDISNNDNLIVIAIAIIALVLYQIASKVLAI